MATPLVPHLVGDLNTLPLSINGESWLAELNGTLFFFSTEANAEELWASDGRSASFRRIKQFQRILRTQPTAFQGALYFLAQDSEGEGLWKTDGTAPGTVRLQTFSPISTPWTTKLTATPQGLFFNAPSPQGDSALWRSDGTTAGTFPLASSSPATSEALAALIPGDGVLYFSGNGGSGGAELWRTDGTVAGTWQVHDIRPGPEGSQPGLLGAQGSTLYLTADDGTHGRQLWKSDGTAEGTTLVAELVPGPPGIGISEAAWVGGAFYFTYHALPGFNPSGQLWRTDGTAAGTVLVKDFGSGLLQMLRSLGDALVFFHRSEDGSQALLRSDGTEAGTVAIHEFPAGAESLFLGTAVAAGPQLFFSVTHTTGTTDFRHSLWRSNGTPQGTYLLVPSKRASFVFNELLPFEEGIAFFNGTPWLELWKSNGTVPETLRIGPSNTRSSLPMELTPLGGTLFFTVSSPVSVLWKSDGLGVTQVFLPRLCPCPPRHLTAVGDTLYFAAGALWKTDGTTTQAITQGPGYRDSGPRVTQLTNAGSTVVFEFLYYNTSGTPYQQELRSTRGVPGEAPLLRQRPSPLTVKDLTGVGSLVFFQEDNALWRSDGTPEGTLRLKPFHAPLSRMTAVGTTLYFVADDGSSGAELWRSDGTPEGTLQVKDLLPGPAGSKPEHLMGVGDVLYFAANDGSSGVEPWRSDGTAEGTVRLRDIAPGPASSSPESFVHMGDTLFFTADDGISGREPWRSDGAEAGTVLLKDVHPGPTGSSPSQLRPAGRLVFFSADEGRTGLELWRSDGSEVGTVLTADISPGSLGSEPGEFTAAGRTLFFAANDGTTGRELWAMALPDQTPPELLCPAPQSARATSDDGTSVDFPPATVSDDSTAEPVIQYSHAPGSIFPVGTTVVTVTATDEAGNSSHCEFTVTVTRHGCGCSSSSGMAAAGLLALAALLRRRSSPDRP